MGYINYTIRGKTDGFGCQYNAIMSGIALCMNSTRPQLVYRHTPMRAVSHGCNVDILNDFIGLKDGTSQRKIHKAQAYSPKVFGCRQPSLFYTDRVIDSIRQKYWSTEKPDVERDNVSIHIRRGDVHNRASYWRTRIRYVPNEFYASRIECIANLYPNCKISIHSEGRTEDFSSITENLSRDILDRVDLKLNHDITETFHEMVASRALFMSRSGLSFTAGILCEGDIFFQSGSRSIGQRWPLSHWNDWRSLD